jgi:hypothetical protein
MRISLSILLLLLSFQMLQSQSLLGAWVAKKSVKSNTTTKDITIVFIFSENHHAATSYDAKTGAFMATFGGSWTVNENTLTQTIEFDSKNPDRIGRIKSYEIELTDDQLYLKEDNITLKRIDNGTPGALKGAWLMSGKKEMVSSLQEIRAGRERP